MSAVKRHPTELVILEALDKTSIDPKNFPIILEALAGTATHAELATKYGMARSTVSLLVQRAHRRLKEYLPGGIWVSFEGGRLPIALVRKLDHFAQTLDAAKDDETKRDALRIINAALLEAESILKHC
jgi:hypothetical protein